MYKKSIYLSILLPLITFLTHAQDGPYGIRSGSDNAYWYSASNLSLSNGSSVQSWSNAGFNSDNASQNSTSSAPIFQNTGGNTMNGNSVVVFDGTDDFIGIPDDNDINLQLYSHRSVTVVVKTGSDVTNRQVIYDEGGATRGFNIYIYNGEIYVSGWNDANDGAGAPWSWTGTSEAVSTNTEYIITYNYKGDVSGTTGTLELFINGIKVNTATSLGQIYAHSGDCALGVADNHSYFESGPFQNDGYFFNGVLADFLMHHDSLNEAEIITMHNSIAAKYGISISNDFYTNDNSGNGNFDHDVVGLYISGSGHEQLASKGSNVFELNSPSGLSDFEYVFIGHDNGSISSWNSNDIPNSTFNQRVTREWRANVGGVVDGVQFELDANDLPSVPSGYELAIFTDSDGNFNSGASTYRLSLVSGTTYKSGDITLSDGDYLAVGIVKMALGFVSTVDGGDESSDAEIEIQLNFIPKSDISIDINYNTTNGSATSGVDFTGTGSGTQSVTFSSTNGIGVLIIPVTDDAVNESNETFQVTLTSSSDYTLSGNTNVNYSIYDNDNSIKIYFKKATTSKSESITSETIEVNLSSASASDVSFNYSVSGGVATNGVDYNLSSGTITITGGLGLTSASIPVTIVNDAIPETTEEFFVTLSSPNGASLDNPSSPVGTGIITHKYNILNDDSPVVQFDNTSSTVSESDGTIQVDLSLDQAHASTVRVDYNLSSISAGTSDYTSTSGTVIFQPGFTSKTIDVSIIEDCLLESTEDFSISLSNPDNSTLGTNTIHTVNISDNDGVGPAEIGCGLTMWYKSDVGITTSGTAVTNWSDASASNNDTEQPDNSNRPTLESTSEDFNYHDALSFDGSNDYLAINNSYNTANINKLYSFVVYKTDQSSSNSYNNNWSFVDYDRSEYYNSYVHGNGTVSFSYTVGGTTYDNHGVTPSNDDIPHIGTFIYDNSVTNETVLKLDGSVESTSNNVNNGEKIGKSGTTRYGFIGDGSEASSFNDSRNNIYYNGDIAEIIVFENSDLGSEDINKIESYLAIKYGITYNGVDDGSTNGVDERDYRLASGNVVWDYSSNSAFSNDIAGLGRHDNTGINQSVSKNTGTSSILKVTANSAPANGNFIMWGNNGESSTSSSQNSPPSISVRTGRIWKVQETGQTGNLSLEFDLSAMADMPTNVNDFVLLLDTDSDFRNATEVNASSLSNGVVTFNNVNLADGATFAVGCWKSIIWDGSNYSNGSGSNNAPNTLDIGRRFYVSGNGGVLNINAKVKEIEIANSASFTVAAGMYIETPGGIVNDGTITLENNASLIQTHSGANANSGSGNYIVKRTGETNTLIYDAWGSPIQNSSILGSGGVFDGTNPCDIFTFDAATQSWKYDYTDGFTTSCLGNPVTFGTNHVISGGDGVLDVGRGYFVPGDAVSTRQFEGEVNDGDISISVSVGPNPTGSNWSGDNWNLVSNPYPSGLDAASFITANNSVISGSIYFWDQNTTNSTNQSDYVVWNAAGTVDQNAGSAGTYGVIGSGQGFYVEAISNGTVDFTNSMRSTDNSTFYKTQYDPNDFDRIRISAINPLGRRMEQLIAFYEFATDGHDNMYDSRYLEGDGQHHFYSVLDEEPMIIQTYEKLEHNESKAIPLGLRTSMAGKFNILLDNVDNFTGDIILFDSLEMNAYDMRTSTPQILLDSAGTYNNRFYLMVKGNNIDSDGQGLGGVDNGGNDGNDNGGTTSIEELLANDKPVVQTREDHLLVKSLNEIENIDVYDVVGRKIMTTQSGKNVQIPFGETTKIVILKINMKNGDTVQVKHMLPAMQ